MAEDTTPQKYLFSQYSTSKDTVDVRINGIPFKIRRSLDIHERQKIQDKLLTMTIGKDGKPQFGSPQTADYTIAACLVAIIEWPFVDENDRPVPINKETVAALDPSLQDQIAARALGYYDEVNKEAVPFGKKSKGHS